MKGNKFMESVKRVKMEKWAVSVMLLLGILFYFVPGKWVSIESDSVAYLEQRGRQGVLPGYPAFLNFFRMLMGEEAFLNGVVIAQCVLAIICTFVFVMVLQRQFSLRGGECILLYLGTMLPFSIYLPEAGITHQIMTEGITYALFYLYFITVLKTVWTLKVRWYGTSVVMAYILGLIRTQMLFLQAIGVLMLLWLVYKKYKGVCWKKLLFYVGGIIFGVLIAFASYKLIYAVVALDNARIVAKAQEGEDATGDDNRIIIEQNGTTETLYVSKVTEEKVPAQFDAVIISRGFYEADKEDVELFEDEMMRQIFLRTYELADENGKLYPYAGSGLYMWENLVYDGMADFVDTAVTEYDEANPGVRTRSYAGILRELGLKILFQHFGRYLYHVLRLMLPSFIASVFFQIKPIYLLCHFITLFIYLFALGASWWVGKKARNREAAEFALTTVFTIMIMVVILNLVFIGIQRYVVYGMGIFYCAMYLLVKEMYLMIRGKTKND